ncbi:hypothetical protein FJ208_01370, partial [Candidatus Gribaldobacteria bacterium]|nr:hypothetical protein [Candidatus Gribaldobacteria bacterium]
PFSQDFSKLLKDFGLTILEDNQTPQVSPETEKKILEEQGQEVLRRIKYKLKRHLYFLARKDGEIDVDQFAAQIENIPIFALPEKEAGPEIMAQSKKSMEELIEAEQLDYNICLTITLNPLHFLEKKEVNSEYLREAILGLKEKTDYVTKIRLYKTYFGEPRLSEFCDVVFEVLVNEPRMKNYFSLALLGHENQRVRELFNGYLKDNIVDFVEPILASNFSADEKISLLKSAEPNEEFINFLSRYIGKNSQDIAKIIPLFQFLPQDVKIDLPLDFRFQDGLADYYSQFAKDFQPDGYNQKEVKGFLNNPTAQTPPEDFLKEVLYYCNKQSTIQPSVDFFLFLDKRVQEPSILQFIQKEKDEIQRIVAIIKNVPVTREDAYRRACKFEKEIFGVEERREDKKKITESILRKSYEEVYSQYFKKRKRIENEKESFLTDVKKAIQATAEKSGVPYEVFLFDNISIRQGDYPSKRLSFSRDQFYPIAAWGEETAKGKQMTDLVNSFLKKERKIICEKLKTLPEDERMYMITHFSEDCSRDWLSAIVENVLKGDYKILDRPIVKDSLLSSLQQGRLTNSFLSDLLSRDSSLLKNGHLASAIAKAISSPEEFSSDEIRQAERIVGNYGETLFQEPVIEKAVKESIQKSDFNSFVFKFIQASPEKLKIPELCKAMVQFRLSEKNEAKIPSSFDNFLNKNPDIFNFSEVAEIVLRHISINGLDNSLVLRALKHNDDLALNPEVLSLLNLKLGKGGALYDREIIEPFIDKCQSITDKGLRSKLFLNIYLTFGESFVPDEQIFDESVDFLKDSPNKGDQVLVQKVITEKVHDLIQRHRWSELSFLNKHHFNSFSVAHLQPQFS